MDEIDPSALQRALATDGEFLRAARQWTGSFAFTDGAAQLRVRIESGIPASVEVAPAGAPSDIVFGGPPAGWERVFSAVPPPFYQDLVGGAVGRHGFTVSGDLAAMSAHYGAIQRAVVIAGAIARSGVPA